MDTSDPLDQERFTFQQTKQGLVQISFEGEVVTRLAGKQALRFLNRIDRVGPRERQLQMAKATGHFKHGNERPIQRR